MRQKPKPTGTDNPLENQESSMPSDETQKQHISPHVPRAPRPFAPRGSTDKHALYKREWYLAKRAEILQQRHDERAKAHKPRTPAQKASIGKRISTAKKKAWKQTPVANRQKILRNLDAGRAVQAAKYAELRRPWEITKGRLTGEKYNALVERFGPKPVQKCLRGADIPKGNRCIYDRARAFTRGSATALQKSLGFTGPEFAQRIGIRTKRPAIWITKPGNNLDPSEARKCLELRDQVARKLLSDEAVKGLPQPDQYRRVEVVAALFPNLNGERKLLTAMIPVIRHFVRGAAADAAEVSENEIGDFVWKQAFTESKSKQPADHFRQLLRWLHQLMPWILENRAILRSSESGESVVNKLLSSTCLSPMKIAVRAATERQTPIEPKRMRELIRQHLSPAPVVRKSKGGAPKKGKPEFLIFGEIVQPKLQRFRSGFNEFVIAKKENASSGQAWLDRLVAAGFSKQESSAITASRNPETAAIRWASENRGLTFKTGKNYWSQYQRRSTD